MKKILTLLVLGSLVTGCVKPPEVKNNKPTFTVRSEVTNTYPGSSFRIAITEATDSDSEGDIAFSWSTSLPGVTLSDSNDDYAEFKVSLGVSPNQQITVTGTAKDSDGAKSTASVTLNVVPEPFILIDAETNTFNDADSHPIYLTGVYSAKAINLKSEDTQDSDNYIIDVSPNGRFVFYTQLMANADWVARLYDATTDLNHTVNISFTDIDEQNVTTYWSNDSQYLAIKLPNELNAANDQLLWFGTDNLTELATIEPSVETIQFDNLVWSDNNTAENEPPYASVGDDLVSTGTTTTVASMKVFDPASETPFTELLVGTAQTAFSNVSSASVQWTNNQMFFIGSTQEVLTAHEMNLYRWKPSTGLTEKINGASTNITKFTAYKATQIVYTAANSGTPAIYYFNGVEEATVTSGSLSSPDLLDYAWSPNGRVLGMHYNTFFSTWEPKNGAVIHLAATDGISMNQWNWDVDYNSVTMNNPATANTINVLYSATTDEANTAAITVDSVKIMSLATTNVSAEIFSTLQRSPTGKWQLYWALKTDATDEHIDLWAYNTETQSSYNISQLKEPYEAPVSEGLFTTQAGFDGTERKWVGTDIIWLNDNELVFKVLNMDDAAVTTPEIIDIRMVSLETMAPARSLVLNPTTKTELTRVVSK